MCCSPRCILWHANLSSFFSQALVIIHVTEELWRCHPLLGKDFESAGYLNAYDTFLEYVKSKIDSKSATSWSSESRGDLAALVRTRLLYSRR